MNVNGADVNRDSVIIVIRVWVVAARGPPVQLGPIVSLLQQRLQSPVVLTQKISVPRPHVLQGLDPAIQEAVSQCDVNNVALHSIFSAKSRNGVQEAGNVDAVVCSLWSQKTTWSGKKALCA